ncbi:MAG: hypothetical protein ABJB74_20685 [Gemmatimonas sp.]
MSFLLPLLLAGALAAPIATSNVSVDDKRPRAKGVVIDTTAHRQLASSLIVRAREAAATGSLEEARAELLVANTMLRESGGVDEASVYALVHIDYALDRYVEAGDMLNELSDEALKKGDVKLSGNAAVDAGVLYHMAGKHTMVAAAVQRVRSLMKDPRMSGTDRAALRKRVD